MKQIGRMAVNYSLYRRADALIFFNLVFHKVMKLNSKLPLTQKLAGVAAKVLKNYFTNSITAKIYKGTGSNLYYERSQHLMFAFKKELTYEPIVQAKVKDYINPSNLIFDIGGNIGQYALLFSRLVGSDGKVITLEPDFKNFAFLQFNLNINNLTNVVCLKKGVGASDGVIEFYRDTETGGRQGSFEKAFVGENFKGFVDKVDIITFDALIDQYGQPDFVKIDVEGFEANIVKGLSYSLDKTVFLIEVREETQKDVFDYFQKRGYQCYHVDEEEDVLITNHTNIPGFANLLFKKN